MRLHPHDNLIKLYLSRWTHILGKQKITKVFHRENKKMCNNIRYCGQISVLTPKFAFHLCIPIHLGEESNVCLLRVGIGRRHKLLYKRRILYVGYWNTPKQSPFPISTFSQSVTLTTGKYSFLLTKTFNRSTLFSGFQVQTYQLVFAQDALHSGSKWPL